MTDGPRQTHRLVTEILTVLERHGHHAHDHEHTDQAIAMITELVGIYDGTVDVPASTGRHAASAPHPEPPVRDSLVLAGADLSAAFAALNLAAEYKRDLVETCPDCADRSCDTCLTRIRDAQAFDGLADRILQRQLAARPADHNQPEHGGPAAHQTRPTRTSARKLADDQSLPAINQVLEGPPGRAASHR